jgi:hypothetical protein
MQTLGHEHFDVPHLRYDEGKKYWDSMNDLFRLHDFVYSLPCKCFRYVDTGYWSICSRCRALGARNKPVK